MTDGKIFLIFAILLLNVLNTWWMFSSKQYKSALFGAFCTGFVFYAFLRQFVG